ncbi:hypothetical protein A0H81_06214 [Grifola frondosa]|uniref:Uncharacterized protein n=1 Tax=Grifola frondosa TaxID=5627 RepID=A0A1C7MBH0_GRIFR|nr:hypothetical protein A0H81_06214 [Grifola frondosa]
MYSLYPVVLSISRRRRPRNSILIICASPRIDSPFAPQFRTVLSQQNMGFYYFMRASHCLSFGSDRGQTILTNASSRSILKTSEEGDTDVTIFLTKVFSEPTRETAQQERPAEIRVVDVHSTGRVKLSLIGGNLHVASNVT